MTRALVTGAAGFIGSRLVERLVADGMDVRALVRRGLVAAGERAAPVERVRGDVTDADAVARAADGCAVIHHCAWGGATLEEGRRINVQGTLNVVRAAAAAGVRRVVHLSTMSVHGPRLPAILTEECPLVFEGDPYGVTKAEGERAALQAGAALGVEVVALRPTLVYGPGAHFWVRAYLDRTRREALALVDGGAGLANLVYVDDVVDAMRCAAERPGVAGEAFLVSGCRPVTWREYLGHFARMAGKPLPPSVPRWRAWLEMQFLRVYGTLTGRPRRLVGMDLALMTQRTSVSIAKAERMLGWTPRVSLREGMAGCEAWAREEGILRPQADERPVPAARASVAS
jgi:nucleoside-diphosphate-sugar epimerase